MTVKFGNRVKHTLVGIAGTGDLTFGTAVAGYQTFSDASYVAGDVCHYTIENGAQYEIGTGTITVTGGVFGMSRAVIETSETNNAALVVPASATCFVTVLAQDIVQNLPNLLDVDTTLPNANQVLAYDSTIAKWKPVTPASSSGGISISSVGNYAGLPASPSETDLAWVEDTKSLYIYDGTEWDRVNSGSDALPEITTVLPTTLNFQPSSANVVTIAANDPDGFPLTYDFDTNPADVSSIVSSVNNANNGTFTINTTSGAGSFSFRAKVNDGVHTSITTSTVTVIPSTPIINSISPALPGGETSWNFDVDGSEINLDAGETYTFTAAGQFALDFEIFGAGGGGANYTWGYKGGGGGRATGRTTLAYDQTYTLVVGGKGEEGGTTPSGGSQGSGGDGGGANAYGNAGGGDLSGFFKGSGDIATFAAQGHGSSSHTPIAIAGGGGGGGSNANGGIGGGTSGSSVNQSGTKPAGGSQTTGGVAGIGTTHSGSDGSYLIGGQGGVAGGSYTGSGAGGGYFGGGGGGHRSSVYVQGAAGGSGYFNTSLVTNGVLTDGDTTSVALNYLDGSSQTSGKGSSNGTTNGTDGRVKLTKVT